MTPPETAEGEGEGVVGAWVRSGGRVRTYSLSRPVPTTSPSPLLVVFHGSGGDGAGARAYSGFDSASAALGYIVAYPDGVAGSWAAGCECTVADGLGVDDVRFLRTLIDQIDEEVPVDRTRVFAAGFSQGSMMAQRLACDAGHLIAGFAGVGAGLPRVLDVGCRPVRPIPGVLIHGDRDPVVPWGGTPDLHSALDTADKWAARNGCESVSRLELPDVEDDGTSVWVDLHEGCASGARLHFYGIQGGGHTWPGTTSAFPASLGRTSREISATERILAFLNKE